MTSRSTQESTSVTGRIGTGSLATEQRHDLVSTQARHVRSGSRVTQPSNKPPASAFRPFGAHYLQRATHLDNFNLITWMQAELRPQVRRDSHLPLAIQHHGIRTTLWPVLLLLRNTIAQLAHPIAGHLTSSRSSSSISSPQITPTECSRRAKY
jgi:hypothetical protein